MHGVQGSLSDGAGLGAVAGGSFDVSDGLGVQTVPESGIDILTGSGKAEGRRKRGSGDCNLSVTAVKGAR